MVGATKLGDESTEAANVRVIATFVPKVNLADFQNSVPILRELSVVNEWDVELKHVVVVITSEPPFLRSRTWRIDAVGPGKSYRIADLDLQLDGALLSRLTEAEKAAVQIAVRAGGPDGAVVAEAMTDIELLPRNQWGGLGHMPDMVAAFVQPNDPTVDRLLKQAAEILRKNGKSGSLDGYKGGAKRAWELASAIWSAVAAMGLDYALPPASFEHAGQKVRGPGQVADSGLATCMDLALLFCAALEQTGLNPVLVFTAGHAFVGVWLKEEDFSTAVVDDVTALRKRLKLKELVLFETTLVTQRPVQSFAFATHIGAKHISEEEAEKFELAVDIKRARLQRVKPLASAETHAESIASTPTDAVEPPFEEAPDLPDDYGTVDDSTTGIDPTDRLARWQRKLLDLSLRNNLLNFRGGKKGLKLDAPDPGLLEDLLSDGQALKMLPRPELMDGNDPRSRSIHEGREREDVRRQHAIDALQRREIYVGIPKDELDSQLVELYRGARTTLQEGGANTLYLALGFLVWNREDKADTKYRAPLILIPVSLTRKSARAGFTLTLHDDEPRFNPPLIEMLRQDFQLSLGVADGELARDDSGLDVEAIWRSVSHAIRDVKGWEVSEDVVLSMFSFAKYLMWKDLVERTDQLKQNAVVKHLIDTPRDSYPSGVGFPNPRLLDQELPPEQTFCPLPVDSSQLSAVMAAVRGKDFVLIGPPGTGKSQTISNLIAQCLAEGKRVLFVSEKIAALDVVYRRLREVGLGEFCLEVHSSKARKTDVLAQLSAAWDARGDIDPEVWRAEAQRLGGLRSQLNTYVERLHHKYGNGLNVYDAIGVVSKGYDVVVIPLSWATENAHPASAMEVMRDTVGRLGINAEAVGSSALISNALSDVGQADWSPGWQQNLVDAARSLLPVAKAVQIAYKDFAELTKFPVNALNRRARAAISVMAATFPNAAGHDWRFVLRPDANALCERLRQGAEKLTSHAELTAKLSPGWPADVISTCERGIKRINEHANLLERLPRPWHCDTIQELVNGLNLLAKIDACRGNLSVKYTDRAEELSAHQMLREWRVVEKLMWPMSWFGKRKLNAVLSAVAAGDGEPNVCADLKLLAEISDLKDAVAKIEIDPAVLGLWAGLRTRVDFVKAAIKFQNALEAARTGRAWTAVGLEPVENGRCGEALATSLQLMRKLQELDREIDDLKAMETVTDGLWAGLATSQARMRAALEFQDVLRLNRPDGAIGAGHDLVRSGECGLTLASDIKLLDERALVESALAEFEDLGEATGGLWAGLKTPGAELRKAVGFHSTCVAVIANLANDASEVGALKSALSNLLGECNALLEPSGAIAVAGVRYRHAISSLQPALDKLAVAGHFDDTSKANYSEAGLDQLIGHASQIVQSDSKLHSWCAWRKVRQEAISLGLASLVAGLENGAFAPSRVRLVFETNYCRWWLVAAVDRDPVVRGFVSAVHEQRIADFRALDEKFTGLTKAWVRANLCAGLPALDGVSRNSEWGVLRHEISKKKRHLPLRELMSQIPTVLSKLTPCLLMSPLSIAQYLSAETAAFDVVVFDEASQIPVWDAIGAIARGKQVVMVGDPKQLPPTSFFDRAESDADSEDVEADLESILDECLGANLPTMNLSWHYRSRNESLIAFSNHRYYGGGLITFPSPVTVDGAVSFHFVPGAYEKGGARINKPEAYALVADIVAKLKSPGFKESRLTIGVVTFNSEQQSLIEDLLDAERRKDPSLEPYFSEMELEPIFVKNLESVQGDERDIMYFSITYGPDHDGNVSMNFGPMNREGGERRLNVAITRARHELRVFSSLKAEKMDLSRTKAIGVRDLKHFLEFAERGPAALTEAVSASLGGFESPFEQAVAEALQRKGWQVHTQIGASKFRVDLAVVHPDARGVYLTGVECDGATYHRSATAKDRDKLREQVLRGLGWEIVRIWSTDWWIDTGGTLERVHARLQALLEHSRARRAELQEQEDAANAEAEAAIGKAMESVSKVAPGPKHGDSQVTDVASGRATDSTDDERVEQFQNALYAEGLTSEGNPFELMESDPAGAVACVEPDRFFERSYDDTLRAMVAHVVETEGPVLDAVLAKRIARVHGWQRTGARIQERVTAIARVSFKATDEGDGTFYWPTARQPQAVMEFRTASENAARTVDEVCLPELIGLARRVLATGRTGEEALVAMAREVGLMRLRATSRGRFEDALKGAEANTR